jgi:DNA mismatch endonuclease (patch repair protein)
MCSALHHRGLRFRKNVRALPGSPDIVFPSPKVAVFIDGDFWHGYRFPEWEDKVSEFWREKIQKNRQRDKRNFGRLRRMGWQVLRIWQHQIERDLEAAVALVVDAVRKRRS